MLQTETVIANIETRVRELGIPKRRIMPSLTNTMDRWRRQGRNGDCQSPTLRTVNEIADALGCSLLSLIEECVPDRPAPPENVREPVGLFDNTGSGLEAVTILWETYEGTLCDEFIARMRQLGFLRKSQTYQRKGGRYVYAYMGDFYTQTLGPWAMKAPGNIVGENDPDPVYAAWTIPIWEQAMDEGEPRRWTCNVASNYGGPKGLYYEGFYGRMGNKLLMVAQAMQ